jgi:hypothetical protein
MRGADFSEADISSIIFSQNDLSTLRGLEQVHHGGPSTLGLDTIYLSKGNIPEVFLRGVGAPENFITYARSLVGQVIEFYSCFISYSSRDQHFADRFYVDLQSNGVRCWFAPQDLKIGAEIRTGVDESIRVHDKLLLILSEFSVNSQWVQQEVETALATEREQGRTVLFPIRLDDAIMEIKTGWQAYLRNTRNIGDFRNWKDHTSYQNAINRLLRDLKSPSRKTPK